MAICKNPGISQDRLAKLLYINKSSVARCMQTLESAGIIRRVQCESDRRSILIYPTDKAENLLPFIKEVASSWNDFLFEALDDNEKEIFIALLQKVSAKAASFWGSCEEDEQ